MSRGCIYEQPSDYRLVYIQHYVGLSYLCAAAFGDLAQLPGWALKARLSTLYSHSPLESGTYLLALLAATLVISLEWACWVEWSTEDGSLEAMAGGVCLPSGLAVLVLASLGLKLWSAGRSSKHSDVCCRGCAGCDDAGCGLCGL